MNFETRKTDEKKLTAGSSKRNWSFQILFILPRYLISSHRLMSFSSVWANFFSVSENCLYCFILSSFKLLKNYKFIILYTPWERQRTWKNIFLTFHFSLRRKGRVQRPPSPAFMLLPWRLRRKSPREMRKGQIKGWNSISSIFGRRRTVVDYFVTCLRRQKVAKLINYEVIFLCIEKEYFHLEKK